MKKQVKLPKQFQMSAKDRAQIFTFSIPDAILFSNLPRTEILLFCVYYGFRAQGKSCHWTDYQLANKLHSSRSRISSYTNDLEKRGLIYCDKYRARTPYGIKPRRAVIGINYDFCRQYSNDIRRQRQAKLAKQSNSSVQEHQSQHISHNSNPSSYTEHSSHTELKYPKSSSVCEQSSYTEQNLKKSPNRSSVCEQQMNKSAICCSACELSSSANPRHDKATAHGYNNIYNNQYNKSITPKKEKISSSSSSLRAPHKDEAPKDDDDDLLNSSVDGTKTQNRGRIQKPEHQTSNDEIQGTNDKNRGLKPHYHHMSGPSDCRPKTWNVHRRLNRTTKSKDRRTLNRGRSQESAYNQKLPTRTRNFSLMAALIEESSYYKRELPKWEALGASRRLISRALGKANDNLSDENYTIHRIISYARACIRNALADEA